MKPESLPGKRFDADREEIGRLFFDGEDPGEISSAVGTGDRHLHGESVARLGTSRGFTLYYKPRDCRSTNLLGELTELLFDERMVPEQITGEGYAFQKAVGRRPPETETEKAGYYKRLGHLTALFYALGSTDIHGGNVICAGDRPVVIDTETLLCAKVEGVSGAGDFSVDYGDIFPDYRTSVGESMILPRFYNFTQTSPLIPAADCLPDKYEAVFLSGFQDGYRLIREKSEDILCLLSRYSDAPIRYLLRSTRYYAAKIVQYRNAKDDAEKACVFKGLEKGLSETDLKRWAPVLKWERRCILEENIPYFWLRAGGCELMGGTDDPPLIPKYLTLSPIEYAAQRIGRMDRQDMAVQTAYIRAGLRHIDGWEQPGAAEQTETGSEADPTPLTVREAVGEVEEALKCLWEERIPLSEGRCLWHAPLIRGRVGSLFGLAEGFSGIAVFVHACTCSPLITGEAAKIAKELSATCFRDMASFGEYLLKAYPEPPAERIIFRRFDGGFDFPEGLSGFLWALRACRDENPERADRILTGFQSWPMDQKADELRRIMSGPSSEKGTDCLEGGTAGSAAMLLSEALDGLSEERIEKAGVILREMVDRKKKVGRYQVFPKGRRLYFLPAFLRGDTGIAYVLLCYATKIRYNRDTGSCDSLLDS